MCDSKKTSCCDFVNQGIANFVTEALPYVNTTITSISTLFAPAFATDPFLVVLPGQPGPFLVAQPITASAGVCQANLTICPAILAEQQRRILILKRAYDIINTELAKTYRRFLHDNCKPECCETAATALSTIAIQYLKVIADLTANPQLITLTEANRFLVPTTIIPLFEEAIAGAEIEVLVNNFLEQFRLDLITIASSVVCPDPCEKTCSTSSTKTDSSSDSCDFKKKKHFEVVYEAPKKHHKDKKCGCKKF